MRRALSILTLASIVFTPGCGQRAAEEAARAELQRVAAQQQAQVEAAAAAAAVATRSAAARELAAEAANTPAGAGPQGKGSKGQSGGTPAADAPGQPAPDPQDAVKAFLASLAKQKIELDLQARTVTIPVIVNRPQNDLEYLLIYPSGKKHEALLITPSLPSLINAALLAVGLERGKNASFEPKEPPPSQAEQEAGADTYDLVPPSGPSVHMTVAYQDAKGRKVEMPVEELLLDWHANLTVSGHTWIFLGGRMASMYRDEPPVFMADYEGNLISVCYRYPNNHLVTLAHERARDEMNWTINRDRCPDAGTEMKLTFHLGKPKVVIEREARMRRQAEARQREGKQMDKSSRPERNPARDGGGLPLIEPPGRQDPGKQDPDKQAPDKQDPGKQDADKQDAGKQGAAKTEDVPVPDK